MGEGTAKTKSYCPKHKGYKKRGGVDDNHEMNHREVCEGDLPPVKKCNLGCVLSPG